MSTPKTDKTVILSALRESGRMNRTQQKGKQCIGFNWVYS